MMDDYFEYSGLELSEEKGPDSGPNGSAGLTSPVFEFDLASAGIAST